jgi:hypothetical protein
VSVTLTGYQPMFVSGLGAADYGWFGGLAKLANAAYTPIEVPYADTQREPDQGT